MDNAPRTVEGGPHWVAARGRGGGLFEIAHERSGARRFAIDRGPAPSWSRAALGATRPMPLPLAHVNLVEPIAEGVGDDGWFLASEWVDGESLGRLVEIGGPLLPEAATFVVAEAARGLAWLHGRRVGGVSLVHGRVTPFRIIVGRHGEVKVAGAMGALDRRCAARPDDAFAAPELRAREPLDPRSDVFSLGATLLHALTGQAPALDELVATPARGPIPFALLAVARRATAIDRAARPDSCAAFREELLDLLAARDPMFGRRALAAIVAARCGRAGTRGGRDEEAPVPHAHPTDPRAERHGGATREGARDEEPDEEHEDPSPERLPLDELALSAARAASLRRRSPAIAVPILTLAEASAAASRAMPPDPPDHTASTARHEPIDRLAHERRAPAAGSTISARARAVAVARRSIRRPWRGATVAALPALAAVITLVVAGSTRSATGGLEPLARETHDRAAVASPAGAAAAASRADDRGCALGERLDATTRSACAPRARRLAGALAAAVCRTPEGAAPVVPSEIARELSVDQRGQADLARLLALDAQDLAWLDAALGDADRGGLAIVGATAHPHDAAARLALLRERLALPSPVDGSDLHALPPARRALCDRHAIAAGLVDLLGGDAAAAPPLARALSRWLHAAPSSADLPLGGATVSVRRAIATDREVDVDARVTNTTDRPLPLALARVALTGSDGVRARPFDVGLPPLVLAPRRAIDVRLRFAATLDAAAGAVLWALPEPRATTAAAGASVAVDLIPATRSAAPPGVYNQDHDAANEAHLEAQRSMKRRPGSP